jgi:hypothetical protein
MNSEFIYYDPAADDEADDDWRCGVCVANGAEQRAQRSEQQRVLLRDCLAPPRCL